jgi:hypothetical protein
MQIVLIILMVVGLLPIGLALWANRATSLFHALVWTLIAWLGWGSAFLIAGDENAGFEPSRYAALCLTGCAGVAVLGARRPHVFAWNFVVLGLFAVMVLPLAETHIIGTQSLGGLRIFFIAGTIAVGILNYLPTRLAPTAALLMLVCSFEVALLYLPAKLPRLDGLLTAVPWIAWGCLKFDDSQRSGFDRLWLSFRDRWGFVWSQRVREQFNHAAEHAGWPVKLTWQGLVRETAAPTNEEKYWATLHATMQRFR